MEDLAPPLCLLLIVRNRLECGESIRTGVQQYLRNAGDDFNHNVRRWLVAIDSRTNTDKIIEEIKSPYRRGVLRVLEKGLGGFPILNLLKDLELEIIDASNLEIQRAIAVLPIKMLLPLLLLQFPSYMVLLLVPFMRSFI